MQSGKTPQITAPEIQVKNFPEQILSIRDSLYLQLCEAAVLCVHEATVTGSAWESVDSCHWEVCLVASSIHLIWTRKLTIFSGLICSHVALHVPWFKWAEIQLECEDVVRLFTTWSSKIWHSKGPTSKSILHIVIIIWFEWTYWRGESKLPDQAPDN